LRTRTIILLLALVLPILAVGTVQAAHTTTSTGTGTVTITSSELVSTRHIGHNILNVYMNTFKVTGILSGTASGTERDIVHTRTGIVTATGHAKFTGTLNGMSGTLLVTYHSRLVNGAITGHFTISGGTNQLAHVTGHGSFTGTTTTPLSYTLKWQVSSHSDGQDEQED
jgi:hypothetical protein